MTAAVLHQHLSWHTNEKSYNGERIGFLCSLVWTWPFVHRYECEHDCVGLETCFQVHAGIRVWIGVQCVGWGMNEGKTLCCILDYYSNGALEQMNLQSILQRIYIYQFGLLSHTLSAASLMHLHAQNFASGLSVFSLLPVSLHLCVPPRCAQLLRSLCWQ